MGYRLIDIAIDQYFIILERLSAQIEILESRIMSDHSRQTARAIYRLKHKMLMLRKAIWPAREAVSHLLHIENDLITSFTQIYLRDVYDHLAQVLDTMEVLRDMTSGMLDVYLSSLSYRMNEVMKVLTIIATIFIPITFIASVYGMNFKYMPELAWRWGYPGVLCLMLGAVSSRRAVQMHPAT